MSSIVRGPCGEMRKFIQGSASRMAGHLVGGKVKSRSPTATYSRAWHLSILTPKCHWVLDAVGSVKRSTTLVARSWPFLCPEGACQRPLDFL